MRREYAIHFSWLDTALMLIMTVLRNWSVLRSTLGSVSWTVTGIHDAPMRRKLPKLSCRHNDEHASNDL
eukprot:694693-Amphidinium_carterae.1